jgi:putative hydrolase of the HAD superfamily
MTMWDCGGVFLTNGWDHEARRCVAQHFNLNIDDLEQRHPIPNDEWERGLISVSEYLQRTVFYVPRPFTQEDFFAQMRAVSRVLYPEMIGFIRCLRATAKPEQEIYLLSNESRELMSYRIPNFLAGLFDAYLVSAYLGLRKPQPEFFARALEIAQRDPAECVFVDDREENVAAAAAAGIHVIRMESPRQAMAALAQFGVTAA